MGEQMDQDRLQQMEDNWNAGDSVYDALGLQLQTQKELAQFIKQSQCEHKYKDFREDTAVCLDCDLDVTDVPLNEAEKESLR